MKVFRIRPFQLSQLVDTAEIQNTCTGWLSRRTQLGAHANRPDRITGSHTTPFRRLRLGRLQYPGPFRVSRFEPSVPVDRARG